MSAGLYVHVPFCTSICPYCDFAVTTGGARKKERFLRALLREIELTESDLAFDTVYLGGGTPSALEPRDLEVILSALGEAFLGVETAMVHMEANPEHVLVESARAWRDLRVGFLSLGIQSFQGEGLSFLFRRHDADDAHRALDVALETGFDTTSVDLIFGLEGQTRDSWAADLERVAASGAQHVSCYQLTIHQGTVFARWRADGRLREMPEDEQATLFERTHDSLAEHGFEAYEVSNFARAPEHRSRHNLKYWNHTPYLGLGPSAHSYRDGRRRWNRRRLDDWATDLEAGRLPLEGQEMLQAQDLATERVMLGLRTTEGVQLDALEREFRIDLLTLNAERIADWIAGGLLRHEQGRLQATVRGLAVADRLAADLVVECSP